MSCLVLLHPLQGAAVGCSWLAATTAVQLSQMFSSASCSILLEQMLHTWVSCDSALVPTISFAVGCRMLMHSSTPFGGVLCWSAAASAIMSTLMLAQLGHGTVDSSSKL
jgi:hypothetical protein